jgi:acetyltransferase-like isoleucine patch superfamily enzyme
MNEMSSSITIIINDLILETDSIINVRWVIYQIKEGIYIFYSITLIIIGIFFFYLSMVKFKVLNNRIDDSLKIIEESILYKETNDMEIELLSEDQSKLINDQIDDQNEENIKEENKVEISKNYNIEESKIDDSISQEEIFENNYDDELDEIMTLIKNNRNEFKINMNSNSNIFMEDKTIIQFQVEVKKIKYLLNFNTENDKSLNNYLLKEIEDKYNNRILTTVQIMSELLSTELIFFDKINQNFSYSGKGKSSVNRKRILELIETNLYDEQIKINKILVNNVIQSFIFYFTDEINEKWAEKIDKI